MACFLVPFGNRATFFTLLSSVTWKKKIKIWKSGHMLCMNTSYLHPQRWDPECSESMACEPRFTEQICGNEGSAWIRRMEGKERCSNPSLNYHIRGEGSGISKIIPVFKSQVIYHNSERPRHKLGFNLSNSPWAPRRSWVLVSEYENTAQYHPIHISSKAVPLYIVPLPFSQS